ncbi:MAG: glycosyl transferase family 2 [Deltaproteobacteria bacterium]|nr:glycosyl transferase family 2 [Deltaproteobacteria bacterium]
MKRTHDTALRPYVQLRLEQIREADLLVGIPSCNHEQTIAHVIQRISGGLFEHYPAYRSVILVSDAGSTDDTQDVAMLCPTLRWQEKLANACRGTPGQASAFWAILEAAERLGVKACAVAVPDLWSNDSAWVKRLLDPVLEKGQDLVASVYPHGGCTHTEANDVAYPLTRALYGKRLRQPTGGDLAFAARLVRQYLACGFSKTDAAGLAPDLWMTTQALISGASVCQAHVGGKRLRRKADAAFLADEFARVCGALFLLMEEHAAHWEAVRGSEPVLTFGEAEPEETEAPCIDLPWLAREFQEGLRRFRPLWRASFSEDLWQAVERLDEVPPSTFHLPSSIWARLLYELASVHRRAPTHGLRMLSAMAPLCLARVASVCSQAAGLDATGLEALVEENARAFEEHKDRLREQWSGDDFFGTSTRVPFAAPGGPGGVPGQARVPSVDPRPTVVAGC